MKILAGGKYITSNGQHVVAREIIDKSGKTSGYVVQMAGDSTKTHYIWSADGVCEGTREHVAGLDIVGELESENQTAQLNLKLFTAASELVKLDFGSTGWSKEIETIVQNMRDTVNKIKAINEKGK